MQSCDPNPCGLCLRRFAAIPDAPTWSFYSSRSCYRSNSWILRCPKVHDTPDSVWGIPVATKLINRYLQVGCSARSYMDLESFTPESIAALNQTLRGFCNSRTHCGGGIGWQALRDWISPNCSWLQLSVQVHVMSIKSNLTAFYGRVPVTLGELCSNGDDKALMEHIAIPKRLGSIIAGAPAL